MSVVVILSGTVARQKRMEIANAVARYGECLPLTESSYALNTPLSAQELSASLKREVGINKGVYIIPLNRSYRGPAPARVKQWLKNWGTAADAG